MKHSTLPQQKIWILNLIFKLVLDLQFNNFGASTTLGKLKLLDLIINVLKLYAGCRSLCLLLQQVSKFEFSKWFLVGMGQYSSSNSRLCQTPSVCTVYKSLRGSTSWSVWECVCRQKQRNTPPKKSLSLQFSSMWVCLQAKSSHSDNIIINMQLNVE